MYPPFVFDPLAARIAAYLDGFSKMVGSLMPPSISSLLDDPLRVISVIK